MVPRCSHGNILLGCPEDVCPDQDRYIGAVSDQYADWYRSTLLGPIPMDSDGVAQMDLTHRRDTL